MVDPKHLTAKHITQIEEAMNTEDLEYMVAVVDRIVGNAKKPDPTPARATQKTRRRP